MGAVSIRRIESVTRQMLSKKLLRICRHRPRMRFIPQRRKRKSNVSDFKRGEYRNRQTDSLGAVEKRNQHRQNIADKRMGYAESTGSKTIHEKDGQEQRQQELPVPMSDQPQRQPFKAECGKNAGVQSLLPNRPSSR